MEYLLTYGYFFERRPRDRWELMRPIVCVERPPASIPRLLLVGFGGEVGSVGGESPVDFLFPFERIPSQMLNGRHPGGLSVSLGAAVAFSRRRRGCCCRPLLARSSDWAGLSSTRGEAGGRPGEVPFPL